MDETTKKVREMMNDITRKTLREFPMWMKCNFLLNSLTKVSNEEIKWDVVNEILNDFDTEIHFNLFNNISSIEELQELAIDSKIAEVPEFHMPYYKKVCKQCGEEFVLTKSEILSFLKKGLKVPNRCYYCRKGIDRPKKVETIKEDLPEETHKTAMQLALEKAGLT